MKEQSITTKRIKDEVHLVRLGELTELDHRMSAAWDYRANTAINIDLVNNAFYVLEAGTLTPDDCGFIRVCVSYEAYQ
jgi:hypothetical protein